MSKLVLGTVTMNAGDGMPGSILKQALPVHHNYFDRIIIVDGQWTQEAEDYYKAFPNVFVIFNLWKDSLLEQIELIVDQLEDDDWFFMLDDDEIVTERLGSALEKIFSAGPLKDITDLIIPRITYIRDRDDLFYPADVDYDPNLVDITDPKFGRRCLCKKEGIKFLSSSGGHHVVPTHDDPKIAMLPLAHLHIKAPEQYVIADCLKSMLDPINERFTPLQAESYSALLKENGIDSYKSYTDSVVNGTWSEDLKKWAIINRFSDSPASRPFMWYFLIEHPEENPDKLFTKERALDMILSHTWMDNMREAKRKNLGLAYNTTPYSKLK